MKSYRQAFYTKQLLKRTGREVNKTELLQTKIKYNVHIWNTLLPT